MDEKKRANTGGYSDLTEIAVRCFAGPHETCPSFAYRRFLHEASIRAPIKAANPNAAEAPQYPAEQK